MFIGMLVFSLLFGALVLLLGWPIYDIMFNSSMALPKQLKSLVKTVIWVLAVLVVIFSARAMTICSYLEFAERFTFASEQYYTPHGDMASLADSRATLIANCVNLNKELREYQVNYEFMDKYILPKNISDKFTALKEIR